MEVPGLSDPDIGDLGSLSQATFAVSIDPPPARSTSPPLPPRENALGLPPTYLTHLRALLHQWLEQQTREDDLNTGHTPARLWDDQRLAHIEEAIWSGAVIPGGSREDARTRLLQLDWQAWAPGSARRKTVWREHRAKVVAESKARRDKADKGDTAKGKKAQEDAARGRLFAPTPVSATLTTPQKSPTRPASVASGGQQSRRDGSRSPMNASPSRLAAEEPEDSQREFNRLITGFKGYKRLSIAPTDEWEVLAGRSQNSSGSDDRRSALAYRRTRTAGSIPPSDTYARTIIRLFNSPATLKTVDSDNGYRRTGQTAVLRPLSHATLDG